MGKRLLIAALLALGLLVAGFFLQGMLFAPVERVAIPSPPPSSIPTTKTESTVVASEVDGGVERQRPGEPWSAVQPGDSLSPDDLIRTSGSGRAVLELGGMATVRIASDSQVQISEISERASRVRLEGGHISAEVRGGSDSTLRVTFKGSDAEALAHEGAFSALTTGDGNVAVASERGDVRLSARNRSVDIGAGQQSIVLPDLPPAAPQQIRPSLFLKLGKPASVVQREKETTVVGESTPGSVVTVNGVRTTVGQDGTFSAKVPLREGQNDVVVQVRSVNGKQEQATLPSITVDSKPLDVTGKVDWK